jgi:hypothetical protein
MTTTTDFPQLPWHRTCYASIEFVYLAQELLESTLLDQLGCKELSATRASQGGRSQRPVVLSILSLLTHARRISRILPETDPSAVAANRSWKGTVDET